MPFALQAAYFSCLAPLLLWLIGFIGWLLFTFQDPQIALPIAFAARSMVFVISIAAFIYGVIGLVGAIKAKALNVAVLALTGLMLNSSLLGLFTWSIVRSLNK